ncbi:MAG: ABC transporter substrate-binding protein [Treponema sp.]|jgi:branched-chain amino acid transport system substrate-binding protein|nr:ABC transporter substrate-binding protein [Treponema sp.]
MKRVVCGLVCGILTAALFAGGRTEAKGSSAGEKVLKLGVLAPLTGTNAEYGKGFQVGMQMGVDRLNAAGGVNGYTLELVIRDSKGDAKESSDLARQFADDDEIYAILGDFTSGACMANAPIVDEAGIVQLSPTASNPAYASMSPYCFSIMGRQDSEAPMSARYLYDKAGVRSVGIIYINSDWGKSSIDNFSAEANRVGLKMPVVVNYVQDEKDFSSLITRLRADRTIEMVLIMDQGAVPQVVNQIRGSGWDIPLATLGPGTSQQLLDLAGRNAENMLVSTPFFFDEARAEQMNWKREFVSKAGFEPTVHPVLAYDTISLIAEAVKLCGSEKVTRKAIRDNLEKVSVVGVSGPIKFNPEGDVTRQYMICQAQNGKWVIISGFNI